MKKLYTLIIITLLPLLTFSQTPNLPDSETGLSAAELQAMRQSDVQTKILIPKSELLRINRETDDPIILSLFGSDGMIKKDNPNKLTQPVGPYKAIREEDYNENK